MYLYCFVLFQQKEVINNNARKISKSIYFLIEKMTCFENEG
jgi:hypothetical protein